MEARHVQSCPSKRTFQSEFHRFLGAADHKVPYPLLVKMLRLLKNGLRPEQVGVRGVVIVHISITSPGRKSGLRSQ